MLLPPRESIYQRGISWLKSDQKYVPVIMEQLEEEHLKHQQQPCKLQYRHLIVIFGFLIHVIIYGIGWTVGVWTEIFLEEFQLSVTSTSLIGSLLNCVLFLSGFLGSVLLPRLNIRIMVTTGGIIASLCLFISSYAPSLQFLYLSFSFGTGIGIGLGYIPSVVMVNDFFPNDPLPMGIATSGIGCGTFIFPPIIE